MVQVIPVRRVLVTVCAAGVVAATAVVVGAGPAAPSGAGAAHAAPPPVRDEDRVPDLRGDRLVVTVRRAGLGADGTFEVVCPPGPGHGSHPDAGGACRAVERNTRWGRDPFAPAPADGVCTMRYGGPATARVTGRWAGRPVDAVFDRSDGCAIERWDRFVPLLPDLRRAPHPFDDFRR
ncbi:SSI family serine proteinase inhibitor [Streptomyces antibioticus]|uniref:SSI family serine proteinase inhibitor n=1 Tax=Streptomyces antibioticus TaxID=1890 RepID=UPI003D75C925